MVVKAEGADFDAILARAADQVRIVYGICWLLLCWKFHLILGLFKNINFLQNNDIMQSHLPIYQNVW